MRGIFLHTYAFMVLLPASTRTPKPAYGTLPHPSSIGTSPHPTHTGLMGSFARFKGLLTFTGSNMTTALRADTVKRMVKMVWTDPVTDSGTIMMVAIAIVDATMVIVPTRAILHANVDVLVEWAA
jgi:hypothetical protein